MPLSGPERSAQVNSNDQGSSNVWGRTTTDASSLTSVGWGLLAIAKSLPIGWFLIGNLPFDFVLPYSLRDRTWLEAVTHTRFR